MVIEKQYGDLVVAQQTHIARKQLAAKIGEAKRIAGQESDGKVEAVVSRIVAARRKAGLSV